MVSQNTGALEYLTLCVLWVAEIFQLCANLSLITSWKPFAYYFIVLLTDWDEYKVESKGREEDGSQNADHEEYMDPEDPNFVVCGCEKW